MTTLKEGLQNLCNWIAQNYEGKYQHIPQGTLQVSDKEIEQIKNALPMRAQPCFTELTEDRFIELMGGCCELKKYKIIPDKDGVPYTKVFTITAPELEYETNVEVCMGEQSFYYEHIVNPSVALIVNNRFLYSGRDKNIPALIEFNTKYAGIYKTVYYNSFC